MKFEILEEFHSHLKWERMQKNPTKKTQPTRNPPKQKQKKPIKPPDNLQTNPENKCGLLLLLSM